MSRLWLDRLHASLAPGSAALLHVRQGLRRSVAAKHHVQSETLPDQPWRAELQSLAHLLAEHGRGKSCSVVLSNHYVRYLLLPAIDLSMSEAEVQSLARHCFVETYGEVARDWVVRIDGWNRATSSLMACAIDEALLAGLVEACQAARIRLASVQPYLAAGFNLAGKRISNQRACFVQVETGRLVLATLDAGRWQGLRSLASGDAWTQDLEACLHREALLAGWSDGPAAAYLQGSDASHGAQAFLNIGGHAWQRLSGPQINGYSPLGDKAYVLAASSL